MYVRELFRRFVGYAQEPDETWFSPNDIVRAFEDAYEDVRTHVCQYYEHAYAQVLEFDAPSTGEVDLSDLGAITALNPSPAPAAALMGVRYPLVAILSLERPSTTNAPGLGRADYSFDAVGTMDELVISTYAYFLRGTVLHFGGYGSGRIRMVWEQTPSVDWTQVLDTQDELIDDYQKTHELIVYYALLRYGLKDGEKMAGLVELIARQEDRIQKWAHRMWPRGRRVRRVRRFS